MTHVSPVRPENPSHSQLPQRRDRHQGVLPRTWLDHSVIPAFDGGILSVDVAVAIWCAPLHVPDRRADNRMANPATDSFAVIVVHGGEGTSPLGYRFGTCRCQRFREEFMKRMVMLAVMAVTLIGLLVSPSRSQDWVVQKRISEAIESRRRGDPALMIELAEPANAAILVSGLQCLESYAKDPDREAREAVAVLIQTVRDPRVIPILATLVGDDSSVSHIAIDILLRNFGRREIAEANAVGLQGALMHYTVTVCGPGSVSAKGLRLLSCFRFDQTVARFLEDLRSVSEKENRRVYDHIVEVPARIGIDLALAELGDKTAIARTKEILDCNDDDKAILFLLGSVRFVSDDGLLGGLVRMTREKRHAVNTFDGIRLRMCDFAVSEFVVALGPDVVGVPNNSLVYRYSDAQLATASARLEAWLVSGDRQQ